MGKSSTERAVKPLFRLMLGGSIAVAAAGIMVSSCSGDAPYGSADSGECISLSVGLDTDVIESTISGSRALGAITAEDLTLNLTSADGRVNRTYSSLAEFDREERYGVGDYTFTAFYGSADEEGFECPYYFGSTDFTVATGRVAEVSVTATLANTMVTVIPTEAFKNYFSGKYSLMLHSAGGAYVECKAGETRPAYLRPGKTTLTATVTMPGGLTPTLEVGSFEAKARTHYKVTVDLADNFGDAEIVVTFDELTELAPVTIVLSDDLANAPAPTVTLQGAEQTTALTHVTGNTVASDLRFDVVAPGQLRSLVLTTTGNPELIAAGWPAEVDLVSASEADKAVLSAMGLRTPGISTQGARFASVVLSDVVPALRGTGAKFTLRATDRLGKTTDPVGVEIALQPQVLSITSVGTLEPKAETMTVSIEYNGTAAPSTLKFLIAENGSDNWTEAKVVSVTPGKTEGTYEVVIEIPLSMKSVKVKVESAVAEGNVVTAERKTVPLVIGAPAGSVWATKAYLSLTSETLSEAALAGASFEVEAAGASRAATSVEVSRQADGTFLISGLAPATSYSVKATVDGFESDPVEFTTEAAAEVPNGDFEDLATTISANLQQGGQWTITTIGGGYTTTVDITVSEPKGWASTNAKTFYSGASNRNTWYMVPSVYNTGLSWVTHQPSAKVMNIGQSAYDATPDEYSGLTAASGSNAMAIRNVAWDAAGASIDIKKQTGNTSFSNYYCSNVPSIANRSAGKLFLGSYSFNGVSETINQGTAFESRPDALTGSYKYVADGGAPDETGVATVELLAGQDVIATGKVNLASAADYTRFTVPLTYTVKDRKATSLRIMFCSSNAANESAIATTDHCNKLECCSRGATLTVDNLKFVY